MLPDKLNYLFIVDEYYLHVFQSFHAPDPDPQLTVTHYERNEEHNEALGLNDMKTENYTEDLWHK